MLLDAGAKVDKYSLGALKIADHDERGAIKGMLLEAAEDIDELNEFIRVSHLMYIPFGYNW